MWDSFFLDLLYLLTDLVSGKSVPLLLAVTLYRIEPFLLGTMVLLGNAVAIIVNLRKTWRQPRYFWVEQGTRLFHCSLSAILSLALTMQLLSHMMMINYTNSGLALGMLACFWVVLHSLPEQPVTLLILFIASMALFYYSLILHPEMVVFDSSSSEDSTTTMRRQLLAMSRIEWAKHKDHMQKMMMMPAPLSEPDPLPAVETNHKHILYSTLPASIFIFVLSVYAGIVHGPLYYFTGCFFVVLLRVYKELTFYLLSQADTAHPDCSSGEPTQAWSARSQVTSLFWSRPLVTSLDNFKIEL